MPVMTDRGTILSLPDAIGRVLEEHAGLSNKEERGAQEELTESHTETVESITAQIRKSEPIDVMFASVPGGQIADFGVMPGCPDCGSHLRMSEGCLSCPNCGFTRCM